MTNPILWIDVPASAVSGGSGSQIDIPNDAARLFFGLQPGQPFREYITIQHGKAIGKKILDWRGDPGLNQQFRLNLLTRKQGGPPHYTDTVLVIELLTKAPISIRTTVLDPASPKVRKLIQASTAAGQVFETTPGRPGSRRWGLV